MNILKRKIEAKPAQQTENTKSADLSLAPMSKAIVTELEQHAQNLQWTNDGVSITQFHPEEAEKLFSPDGTYFAFGCDAKKVTALTHIDQGISTLIAEASLSSARLDLNDIRKKIKTTKPDQFSLLLLEDIAQSINAQILLVVEPEKHPFWENQLRSLRSGLSSTPFMFDDSYNQWTKISLNFSAKALPSELAPKDKLTPLSMAINSVVPSRLLNDLFLPFVQEDNPHSEETMTIEDIQTHWSNRIDYGHTRLKLVLEDFKMTVADCTRLQVGDLISLPKVSLMELNVEADFKDSQVCIAQAALGVHKTRRAAKLTHDLNPEFLNGAEVLPLRKN